MLLNKKGPPAGYPNAERKLRDHLEYFRKPDKPIYTRNDINLVRKHFELDTEEDDLYRCQDKSRLLHLRNPLRGNWSHKNSQASGISQDKSLLYEQYKKVKNSSIIRASRSIDQILDKRNPNRYRYRNHFHSFRKHSTEQPDRANNSSIIVNESSFIQQSTKKLKEFRFKSHLPRSSKGLPIPSLHFELLVAPGGGVEETPKPAPLKKTLKEIIRECQGLSMAEDRMKRLEQAKDQESMNEEERRREFKNLDRKREIEFKDREWKQIMNNEKLIADLANVPDSDD